MEQPVYLGVDIGGTTIKLAFIVGNGDIIHKWEIETDLSDRGSNIVADILRSIETKTDELRINNLRSIGIGAPGFIDTKNGVIYEAVNLGWSTYPLRQELQAGLNIPVFVENDANLAALGEKWLGAGTGTSDLICITLGTGVGGGIIAEGQVLHGKKGAAGEIGHITVVPYDGEPCNCGKTGCLETVASATGIVNMAVKGLKDHQDSVLQTYSKVTAKAVFEAAAKEDVLALKVIDQVCYALGLTLANLANSLNPEMIVIGGGVSHAGDQLLTPLKQYFERFALPIVNESVTFAIAQLHNDAGVIGGGWLAKTNV